MATLKLEGVEQLLQKLNRTQQALKDVHVPFKQVAVVIYGSIRQTFRAGGRPRWPGRDVKNRRGHVMNSPLHREGQLLQDSGRLRNSVGYNNQPDIYKETHTGNTHTLEIGTNVEYANVHQFGLKKAITQHVKAHTRRGKKGQIQVKAFTRTIHQNIPERPFLMLQPEDKEEIKKIFQEWMSKEFSEKR